METIPVSARARRDLVTNPAFDEALDILEEVIRKETARLTLDAQEDELRKIQFQSGVVEGAKRALLRLVNYRKDAVDDFKKEQQRSPQLELA
jgi:hypothetical protein